MRLLLIILLSGLAVAQAVALPDVEVLPANQLRVQEVRDGRAVGAPMLMRVRGMVAGQTLVAAGVQPSTAVLYGFGYNSTTKTGSLYTINQRNFSATLVRSTGIRLPNLPSGILRLDFVATANGTTPNLLRISDNGRNYYIIDAQQATLVSGNETREIPVLDHPYSGAQFVADGTIRNNGLPTADAKQDFVNTATASTENDFGAAGNAGGGQAQMYPNPATYQTRVVLGHTAQAPVVAELVDMNGRLASRTSFPAGREVLNLDVSRVPAGLYVVRVFEGNILTHQLRLVRRDQ
jgi:hypothetical protein